MKEDNPGPLNIHGDNSKEIIVVRVWDILCDLSNSSSLMLALKTQLK